MPGLFDDKAELSKRTKRLIKKAEDEGLENLDVQDWDALSETCPQGIWDRLLESSCCMEAKA